MVQPLKNRWQETAKSKAKSASFSNFLNIRSYLLLVLSASFLAQLSICSPVNTVQVRLKTPLTSYTSKAGDSFECVVLSPWIADNRVIIPEGATVHGHVGKVISVGLGIRHERAGMELVFDDFVTTDGRAFPLEAKLVGIDNAREQITPKGAVRGVLAASQPNQLVFGMWHTPTVDMLERSLMGVTGITHQISSALSLGPGGMGGMLVLRLALLRFPEPEIQYAPGADMRLQIDAAQQQGVDELPALPLEAPDGVAEWLRKEPSGIEHKGSHPASDVVNVAFLGSREQLINAFSVAGWSEADARTGKTKKQAYYAFSAMRAYATAPVSSLFYKGMLPELVFEKSLNTITKRHHIRVWYAGVVDGQELWLGAATHDTGGTFNIHTFKFTHKIDSNLDDERDKVTTDLAFAGCVEPEMRVNRRDAASLASSRGSFTDGAAAVLALSDCHGNNGIVDPLPKPGTPVSRIARRMILEARNHILRENVYYWSFQLVKHTLSHSAQQQTLLNDKP